MSFEFVEGIAMADVAFRANAKTLSALFRSAGQALLETMANPKTVKPKIKTVFESKAETVEKLLFEFLEEIIYLKDKDAMVFHDIKVKVDEKRVELTATLTGDTIKPSEQELHQDVKAVTMHQFKVEKEKEWTAQVVLDI